MKTVKFKELPEKVREFLQREYAFAFILSDSVELDWLHKINEWSKATDEERLAYAEWRFPKGKKFKKLNLFRDGGKEIVSSGEIEISSAGIDVDGNFLYYVDVNSSDPTQVNKWAEIIEEVNVDFNPKSGHWLGEPTFKAGDEVEYQGSTISKVVHVFDGMAWIKNADQKYGSLVDLSNLRKPDPDKVYREIAKEFLREKVYSFDNLEHFTVPKQGLIELIIEAIKKGKEL